MDSEIMRQNSVSPSTKTCNKTYGWIGQRHILSLLLFACIFINYLQRVNISVAIVAMTLKANVTDHGTTQKSVHQTFDWNTSVRSTILSSFFWGYLMMNLPAAVLGRYFNNKYLLAISTGVGSILACTAPLIVGYFDWVGLTGLRLLQGIFQAFMMPMTHGIMSKWAPPQERGRLVGFILGGIQFGTMIILVMAGYLASSPLGWPSIFYTSGLLGLVWVVFWLIFGEESPTSSTMISEEELKYIVNNINSHDEAEEKLKTPWYHIATSLPVWAVVVAHTAHNLGFWLLLTEMPQFFSSVLEINIKEDGMLSSLPYLAMWLLMFPVSYIADQMIQKEVTSITTTRKLWNSIGMWGGTIGLVALGYLDDKEGTAVITYVFIVAIGCSVNVGFNVNHMDLSPNFAGILMGITNTCAAAGGLLAPLSVAYIVKDMKSVLQWRLVFFTGAGTLFFGNLFYIVFASGNLQRWNDLTVSGKTKEESNGQRVCIQSNGAKRDE